MLSSVFCNCRKSCFAAFSSQSRPVVRTDCPFTADNRCADRPRSVFSDAHVAGENKTLLDSRPAARTLQDFLDNVKTRSLIEAPGFYVRGNRSKGDLFDYNDPDLAAGFGGAVVIGGEIIGEGQSVL